MDRIGKRRIVSTISCIVIILIVLITALVKLNESKGYKCYMNSVIERKKYNLSFTSTTNVESNGTTYYYVCIHITNTLDTDQKFTFKNPYFIKGNTKVTFKTLEDNGFIISSKGNDKYYLGCPVYAGDNIKNFKLHFVLNGDKYNLYTRVNETNNTTTK